MTASLATAKPSLSIAFDQPKILDEIRSLSDDALDGLDFGVIGVDADGFVRTYNSEESRLAGLSRERVLGTPLFTTVAPCMNNYMVAQRFEDALQNGSFLDATIDYVFTLRMRPAKVKLRLLAAPAVPLRYVLVWRP